MSITVKHKFVSSIPDSTDTSLVRPTNWNDTHDLTGFGTMAEQNANAVAITGGSINGTTIGATTASTGAFTYISTSSSTSTTPTLSFNASNSPVAMGATISGSYLQTVLQNKSGTAGASTNYVLSNDLGTDSTYYGEFGMNSSVYSSGTPADFFSFNNGVYFSSHDGDVSIGSGNGYKTFFAWGTTGNKAHVINASGAIGLNTNITGTTNFGTTGQVLLSQGSSASPIWAGASSIAGLGTMGLQNANSVAITGGTIDGTDIGQTTPAKIKGTSIEATGSFTGDASGLTGTAPNLTAGNATAAQQLRTLASNGTGVSIPAGKAVYLYKNGTSLQIKLADASTYDTSQVVGVTATVIPTSGTGYVTMHGYISGLDTSAYQYGQILYLSGTTPGDLSATEPVSPLYAVHVCYVMTVNATTGTIFVNPINHSVNDDYFIGLLKINHGGTNNTATPTAGTVAYGDGTKITYTSAGTAGQALLSNGASAPTWGTPAGSLTITDDTTTNSTFYPTFTSATSGTITGETVSSTKFSYNPSTGSITTFGDAFFNGMRVGHGAANVTSNSVVGADSLSVATTGGNNTAMGYESLKSVTTGSNLTAFGYQAGRSATTAAEFNVFGYQAGYSNTDGHGLTAVGYQAGYANVSGTYNTYIGSHVGTSATGDYNAIVGGYAFYTNSTGSNNTGIGARVLFNNNGSNNVVIGTYAGFYETAASNSFYLDSLDRGTLAAGKTGALMYGTFNTTASSQTLKINGVVTASYALTALGGIAGGTF